MRRLEELLRQMTMAAKAIGNSELENKFSEGSLLTSASFLINSRYNSLWCSTRHRTHQARHHLCLQPVPVAHVLLLVSQKEKHKRKLFFVPTQAGTSAVAQWWAGLEDSGGYSNLWSLWSSGWCLRYDAEMKRWPEYMHVPMPLSWK